VWHPAASCRKWADPLRLFYRWYRSHDENRDTLDFENLRDSMRDLAGSGGTLVHQHQRAAEFIQPLHLLLAACRFPGPLPGARRKLARNNGRDKKCKQGDPV